MFESFSTPLQIDFYFRNFPENQFLRPKGAWILIFRLAPKSEGGKTGGGILKIEKIKNFQTSFKKLRKSLLN